MACLHFAAGKFSGILTVADDQNAYLIHVGKRVYFFEWSDRWGPLFVGAKGGEIDNSRIQVSAYRATSLWSRQGKRTTPQGVHLRAIWDEPPVAFHKYVRQGRSRVIVESIVPDGYISGYSDEQFVDVTPMTPHSTMQKDM